MELLIAAGIPSAIAAFCFWLLEKRIQERAEVEKNERACRQREQDEKEENREKLQYMMLKALDGSLCLSEATAKAVQRIPDAKCNGDMHAALNYELEQKHDLENFLTKEAGRLLGVYHYFSGGDPAAEAEFFVKNVKGYIGEAILVLDWEGEQNVKFSQGPVVAKPFLDKVKELTGVRPLIYMSKSVCRAHDWSAVASEYALWVAQYADNNTTGYQLNPWTDNKGYDAWSAPAIFQYSSHGRLAGYSGNLDVNIAYMDAAAWKAYAKGSGATPEPAPAPTPALSTPAGSTLDLVYGVMTKKYGDGDARKASLGTRYNEVQDMINHIENSSAATLAEETKNGRYGNDPVRRTVLGKKYSAGMLITTGMLLLAR